MNLMTTALLKQLRQWIASDDVIQFYHTKEWRKLRQERLRLDHYECQDCKRQGRHTHATTVHHLKHVRVKPELALDLNNTETICRAHHNEEHPEKLKDYRVKKYTNDERW